MPPDGGRLELQVRQGSLTRDLHLLYRLIGVVSDVDVDTDGLTVVVNLVEQRRRTVTEEPKSSSREQARGSERNPTEPPGRDQEKP